MNRLLRNVAVVLSAMLVCPSAALAQGSQTTPFTLHLVVSAAGMAIAVLLLVETLSLRRIMFGGAIAEKLHFVILAVVCLAASALAKWTSNFVSGVTYEQTELISQLLVLLSMGLFFAYFYSVRKAMEGYLKGMRAELPETETETDSADAEEAPRG